MQKGGFQNLYSPNPYNHNPYNHLGILIGHVGISIGLVGIYIRVGHAYAEYANDADYAHMRIMRMRMRIENLIHIIHI